MRVSNCCAGSQPASGGRLHAHDARNAGVLGPLHTVLKCSACCLLQVVPMVLEVTQHAAEHISQSLAHHDTFDVTDAAKRITSDVMGHLLFGEDLRGVTWE
jgi:hypothetical protein